MLRLRRGVSPVAPLFDQARNLARMSTVVVGSRGVVNGVDFTITKKTVSTLGKDGISEDLYITVKAARKGRDIDKYLYASAHPVEITDNSGSMKNAHENNEARSVFNRCSFHSIYTLIASYAKPQTADDTFRNLLTVTRKGVATMTVRVNR
jgi:hypothetical protein